MAKLMTDDIEMRDPTDPAQNPQPGNSSSKKMSLASLRKFVNDNGVATLGVDLPTVFESNDIGLFSGFLNVAGAPPAMNCNYKWHTEYAAIITVRDGEGVSREDFADYAGLVETRSPVK